MQRARRLKLWGNPLSTRKFSAFAKFSRFLAAGMCNALAGIVLFVLFFTVMGFHYLVANLGVLTAWAWFGYELQRIWVFRAHRSRVAFARHIVNQITFSAFGSLFLWVLVEEIGLVPELAYTLMLGIVTAGIYVSSNFWVFVSANRDIE